VRRTVLCLSKLYKCLDHAVFLSVSREMLDGCCQSLESAAEKIRTTKLAPGGDAKLSQKAGKVLDAELFIVKHLLILREQTSPYRITSEKRAARTPFVRTNSVMSGGDMAGRRGSYEAIGPQFDYSLDLSKYKDSVFQLLSQESRSKWFELSTNNAFLSFLLSAPVYVNELQTDSRRIIESQLKKHCQHLIHIVSATLVDPLSQLTRRIDGPRGREGQTDDGATIDTLSPKEVHESVAQSFKTLRQTWPEIRSTFSLYIGVKETEDILLQSIKKAIINSFSSIYSYAEKSFNEEQQQIASVPNNEQITMVLNA